MDDAILTIQFWTKSVWKSQHNKKVNVDANESQKNVKI